MGVDRYVEKNGKYICELARSYHFTDPIDIDRITEFKMILAASMMWPEDQEERLQEVREFNNTMDWFIDECKKLGRVQVCEWMIDEGCEVRDE